MIGVVADDITGANDIGIMFAKAGLVAHVYSLEEYCQLSFKSDDMDLHSKTKADVVIVDTNSRLDNSQIAYDKVYLASRQLRTNGATFMINKTCSVFRGNIGAEFDAMLDALEQTFAVVVLGFPKNGRTTVDGIHYVHGKRLEDSEFRNDPVHPMLRSDLVGILQTQTSRKVEHLSGRVLDLGAKKLREKIRSARQTSNYLILDVRDQADLRTIAEAVGQEFIMCGSSALAEELAPQIAPIVSNPSVTIPTRIKNLGILTVAGSLMPQTAAQIEYAKSRGMHSFEMDTLKLLEEQDRKQEIERLINDAVERLTEGKNVLIHSANRPSQFSQTKEKAVHLGYTSEETSRIVSSTIAEVTSTIIKQTGLNRLLVAGGETSGAVCSMLGIHGLRIWKEIEPGLPSCLSLSDPSMLLVLKSGSFGQESFFESAVQHLLSEHS